MLPSRQRRRAPRKPRLAIRSAVHVVDTVVVGEAEIARLEIAASSVAGSVVELGKDLRGEAVWHAGDVLEAVGEGGDDEGVVVGEGAFNQVEADAARVDEDQPRDRGAGCVDDGRGEGSVHEREDVARRAEWQAAFAVCLWRAAVQCRQVELCSEGGDVGGDAEAAVGVKGFGLRTNGMVGK